MDFSAFLQRTFLTLLIFMGVRHVFRVHGYEQEMILYESESSDEIFHQFTSSIPNASVYPFMENIKRFCFRGIWDAFIEPNYLSNQQVFNAEDSLHCQLWNTTFPWKSWRHEGGLETNDDTLSLYKGYHFSDQEIFVDRSPFNFSQQMEILSLTSTGPSNWTIFEKNNFTGKTYCLQGQSGGQIGRIYNFKLKSGWTTVGSVRKGCLSTSDVGLQKDFSRKKTKFFDKIVKAFSSFFQAAVSKRMQLYVQFAGEQV